MKNLSDLMKQAGALKERMEVAQRKLEETEIEGVSGGGLVRVTLSGKGDLKRIKIDPSLLVPDDVEILEDIVIAAHADARAKLERHTADEMGRMTSSLGLPPGFKMPF
jgi:DNA-binding YbaB/EbfC family protein